MRGSPSIENGRTRAAKRSEANHARQVSGPAAPQLHETYVGPLALPTAEAVRALVATCAVGLLAGLAAGGVRLGLGLPGHKALVWMAPLIAARLIFRSPVGGSAGALAASLGTMAAGGHLAGAAMHLPVAVMAGGVLDVAVHLIRRRRLGTAWTIPLMGLAGLAANLVMLGKRLLVPSFQVHHFLWTSGLAARCLSYAAFGLAAGLVGAGVGFGLARRRRR